MDGRNWTVMVWEGDTGRIRELPVPAPLLRAVAVLSVLAAILLTAVVATAAHQTRTGVEALRLEGETERLARELAEARERVHELDGEVALLARRGGVLHVMAGLDHLHDELLQVGVGGPGSPALEDHPLWQTNRDLGEVAFAVDYDLNALERRVRFLSERVTEAADSLGAHRDLLLATPSILPTPGRISSGYSRSRIHPIHRRAMPHTGIDLAAPHGTPIRAAARGRIVRTGWRAGYGLTVEIDHGHGYRTLYGHASRILVERGDSVDRGDVIAEVGSTGDATAPHLHYEVIVNGRPQNPSYYIVRDVAP